MQALRIAELGWIAAAVAAFASGCGDAPAPSVPAMPWLHGFVPSASTDQAARRGGLEAPLALRDADTVVATFDGGLVILDEAGHTLAKAPGFDRTGSADELVALAVGDGLIGEPMVVLAVNLGGHRESSTWIYLYGVAGNRLDPLFSGDVEDHVGADTSAGTLLFAPGGLSHRAPGATEATSWSYELQPSRYVQHVPAHPLAEPHAEPGV